MLGKNYNEWSFLTQLEEIHHPRNHKLPLLKWFSMNLNCGFRFMDHLQPLVHLTSYSKVPFIKKKKSERKVKYESGDIQRPMIKKGVAENT